MIVRYGDGETEFGPGVIVELDGDDVASAIGAWVATNGVYILGPRTVTVNGDLCRSGQIYADPSAVVLLASGEKFSGRGPDKDKALR